MERETVGAPLLSKRIRAYFTGILQGKSTREETLRQEERCRERVRIARELHDTWLQGLLSASMQLQVAEGYVPADSPAKPVLSRVLYLMGKGIAESRAALQGLRSTGVPATTLEQALFDFHEELAPDDRGRVRILKRGPHNPIDPAILQQIFHITREAVLNALRHSQARKVEAEIQYSPGKLRVTVRDNGDGINPVLLHSGSNSHFGLTGMRERAASINAKLRIRTRRKTGTEVILSLPSSKVR